MCYKPKLLSYVNCLHLNIATRNLNNKDTYLRWETWQIIQQQSSEELSSDIDIYEISEECLLPSGVLLKFSIFSFTWDCYWEQVENICWPTAL